jgi:hypothetical protein
MTKIRSKICDGGGDLTATKTSGDFATRLSGDLRPLQPISKAGRFLGDCWRPALIRW